MIYFGKNLKYLRAKNSLTQREMKDILGVSDKSYRNYENESELNPKLQPLLKACEYFSLTLNELVTNDLSTIDSNTN